MSVIPRTPARPPAKSPNDPRYLDARDLEAELRRTFQVCHECRMCVNYCGSFPEMFARVDRDIEAGRAEGAEAVTDADFRAVVDACWQCKLCYIKCPYTEDEGQSELLDVPRLFAREKAYRAAQDGVSFVDQVLGEPQLLGALGGGAAAPMTNLIHESRLLRKVEEKVAGISSEFPLPPMAKEPFSKWMAAHPAPKKAAGRVALFATCYGEHNAPNVPIAAVRVLERSGIEVVLPGDVVGDEGVVRSAGSAPTCCGMPNLDGGDIARFRDKARHNVELLYPLVQAGLTIVVPAPTCAMTMKKTWAEHLDTEEARAVAGATRDLMEFLVQLARDKVLDRTFQASLGRVAYHGACHLRAQKIGFPGARLLGLCPDTEVRVIDECSAVDGTWGMKAENYEAGRRYAQKLIRGVRDFEPDLVVTDCTLSALRLEQEMARGTRERVRILHPVEALAKAYGLELAAPCHGIVPGGLALAEEE